MPEKNALTRPQDTTHGKSSIGGNCNGDFFRGMLSIVGRVTQRDELNVRLSNNPLSLLLLSLNVGRGPLRGVIGDLCAP